MCFTKHCLHVQMCPILGHLLELDVFYAPNGTFKCRKFWSKHILVPKKREPIGDALTLSCTDRHINTHYACSLIPFFYLCHPVVSLANHELPNTIHTLHWSTHILHTCTIALLRVLHMKRVMLYPSLHISFLVKSQGQTIEQSSHQKYIS